MPMYFSSLLTLVSLHIFYLHHSYSAGQIDLVKIMNSKMLMHNIMLQWLVPLLELNILMSVFLVNIQFPNLASLACHSHTLSALSLFKQWLKITLMWDPLLRDPNTHETQIENSISSVSTSSKKLNFYQFNICKYVPPFYIMPNCYYL